MLYVFTYRLNEYEDRLREAQWTIEDTTRQGREELRATVVSQTERGRERNGGRERSP